jgi:hypothetical protein
MLKKVIKISPPANSFARKSFFFSEHPFSPQNVCQKSITSSQSDHPFFTADRST